MTNTSKEMVYRKNKPTDSSLNEFKFEYIYFEFVSCFLEKLVPKIYSNWTFGDHVVFRGHDSESITHK